MRILFVHPEGNLANNPNLSALVFLLAERGHAVSVRSPRGPFAMAPHPRVKFSSVSPFAQKLLRRLSRHSWCWQPGQELAKIALPKLDPADVVVGVDRQGLLEGAAIARAFGAPLAYLSYEIVFSTECPPMYKAMERCAAANTEVAIAQDKVRGRLLSEETGIPENRILLMPVAGSGARPGPRTRQLHDRFGIPHERKVAISIGSTSDWTMARALANSLVTWPDDWVLVAHDRYATVADWQQELQYRFPERYYISAGGLPTVEEVGTLLHAADLGMALYKPTYDTIETGRNIAHIGLASGKISTYLQHGLPVLTNEIGEMAKHVREHDLGIVIGSIADIPISLRGFNPDKHRLRCLDFFREHLDTALYIEALEKALGNIIQSKWPSRLDEKRGLTTRENVTRSERLISR